MTTQAFRTAVDRGIGRAALALIENDPAPYVPELIGACVRNGQYDYKTEDNRAPYLYRLSRLAKSEEEVLDAVLGAMPAATLPADRHLHRRLLAWFAKNGSRRAGVAIAGLAMQEEEAIPALATAGALAIRWLLQARRDLFVPGRMDDWRLWVLLAEEASEEEDVDSVLTDEEREALEWRSSGADYGPLDSQISEVELLRRYQDPAYRETRRRQTEGFGIECKPDERRSWAMRMCLETDPETVWDMSAAFSGSTWPEDVDFPFDRVDGDDLSSMAWRETLGRIESPQARELALERLRQDPPDVRFIRSLNSNFQLGDEAFLLRVLLRIRDSSEDLVHLSGKAALRFDRCLNPQDMVPLAEWLIEHTPCSQCRSSGYYQLDHAETLTAVHLREMAHDADRGTRHLAAVPRTPTWSW